MIAGKTIFVAPLDWGLGHATRCVPIIRELIQNGNTILLGVTPITRQIFDQEFPELKKITIPAYNIRYSSVFPVWIKLLLDAPRIFKVIKEEHALLKLIFQNHKIDVVISDNRFGLYNSDVRTVFITHQLFLKVPFGRFLAQRINRKYIQKFDEVWIPDYKDAAVSLSGDLSHGKHFHSKISYLGPKSRLQIVDNAVKKYDYLFLISGPEPKQTVFRNLLIEKIKQYPTQKFVLLSNAGLNTSENNLEVITSPDTFTLGKTIGESKTIICRSGYSTLMDLHMLGIKNVILVPTPGQTEQEYLAEYWRVKFGSVVVKQKDLGDLKF